MAYSKKSVAMKAMLDEEDRASLNKYKTKMSTPNTRLSMPDSELHIGHVSSMNHPNRKFTRKFTIVGEQDDLPNLLETSKDSLKAKDDPNTANALTNPGGVSFTLSLLYTCILLLSLNIHMRF